MNTPLPNKRDCHTRENQKPSNWNELHTDEETLQLTNKCDTTRNRIVTVTGSQTGASHTRLVSTRLEFLTGLRRAASMLTCHLGVIAGHQRRYVRKACHPASIMCRRSRSAIMRHVAAAVSKISRAPDWRNCRALRRRAVAELVGVMR